MTIWERSVSNIQKGARKVAVVAATFAERVRAEIAIVRVRIRIDETRSRVDELYRAIGRTVVDLYKQDSFAKATEKAFREEGVLAVMDELTARLREIEELESEIKNVQGDCKSTVKHAEDTIV